MLITYIIAAQMTKSIRLSPEKKYMKIPIMIAAISGLNITDRKFILKPFLTI